MSVTIEEIYKVGKKIESEWFQGGANSKFNEKYEAYHKHRKYARGEHDVEHSKSIITGKEAQSHTNYDFSPIQVLPKFKDRLVNSMFPQLYNIEANAIDKYTTDLKNAERERLMSRFVSKELDSDMKELFGIDMEAASDGDRPNSEEEVEMRMAMDWKPNIEIATEMALKYTYQLNNYDEVLIDLLNDAVDIGRIGVWISMHPVRGIVVERMDPAEAVWSFTKKRDHSDVWYYGMRKRITLSELVSTTNSVTKISTGENILLDDEKFLRKLTGGANEAYRSVNQGNRNNSNELDLNEKVDILYFTYETTETEYLKVKKYKSGAKKVTPFKGEYKGQTIKGVDIIPKKKRLWKEGFIILGTDYAYGKGNVTNQIKKTDKGIKKSYPPAYMYANSLYEGKAKGMIERAEVIIDKMQTVEIKIQQLVAAAKPSGIRIDVSKINNIKTAGGVMDYKTVMKIYNETGTEIYHSGDGDHGEFSQGNIHELRNGVVQGINDLVNIFCIYMLILLMLLGPVKGSSRTTKRCRCI